MSAIGPPASNWWRAAFKAGRPLVIAHRGDSAHAPENTLLAARLGHEAGADAWELDVQMTRDGVAVVFHDDSLGRTTDVAERFEGDPRAAGGFRLADFDWGEIESLDAGSWFLDPAGGPRSAADFGTANALRPDVVEEIRAPSPVRVPTLDAALALTRELAGRRPWAVNIELKTLPACDPRLVPRVLKAIDELAVADRVLISSFDHTEAALVAAGRSDLATGALASDRLVRPEVYCREVLGVEAYHPSVDAIGGNSWTYRRAPSASTVHVAADLHALCAAGVPTLVYTVNDHRAGGLADHLAEAGVAGVFTDNPGPLVQLWSARRKAASR